MTRVFFGKVFYSHGVMTNEQAEEYVSKAKQAGFQTIRREVATGTEVYIK